MSIQFILQSHKANFLIDSSVFQQKHHCPNYNSGGLEDNFLHFLKVAILKYPKRRKMSKMEWLQILKNKTEFKNVFILVELMVDLRWPSQDQLENNMWYRSLVASLFFLLVIISFGYMLNGGEGGGGWGDYEAKKWD